MKFGPIEVRTAAEAILAHAVKGNGINLKKGHVIGPEDVVALRRAGLQTIVAARLEPEDVPENVAAQGLAAALRGENVSAQAPFTGRCNLVADVAGLVCVPTDAVDAVNDIDEALTVATLTPWQPVAAGEMIATVKVIPFSVPQALLDAALSVARTPIAIRPYRPLRVAVCSTLLPALKTVTIDKTLQALEARLAPAGAKIVAECRVPHDTAALTRALGGLPANDLVIVFGASAITDRRDVVPAAVEAAGGEVAQLGMPVDPGNLLLLARLPANGQSVPLIGAPGCARSPKENGFDFVLRRLLVGEPVAPRDVRRMGVGGLLNEIASRPQRRQVREP